MSRVATGAVCGLVAGVFGFGIGVQVGQEQEPRVGGEQASGADPEATTATETTVASAVGTTVLETTTTIVGTTDVLLPLSGITCSPMEVPINIRFYDKWGTFSLLQSIEDQTGDGRLAALPEDVALNYSRDIAVRNGYIDLVPERKVDNWMPNGQAPDPANPVEILDNCRWNGVTVFDTPAV